MLKKIGLFTILAISMVSIQAKADENLTFLYTGASYGAVYGESKNDGSVKGGMRGRAAVLAEEKLNNSEAILIDTGNNSAGVVADPLRSVKKLDRQRSQVALSSLSSLGYDVLALGRDDLANFEILQAGNESKGSQWLASNLKSDLVQTSIRVQRGNKNVTVLSLLPSSKKLKTVDYKKSLNAILKKDDLEADVLVLISALPYKTSIDLLEQFPQIDILFLDKPSFPFFEHKKVNNTIVLSPYVLGKKIGKLTVDLDGTKVKDYSVESLDVQSKNKYSDTKLEKLIPACFNVDNCSHKEGMKARCINPGLASECVYVEAQKPELTIVTIDDCKACDNSFVLKRLESKFPDLQVRTIDYKTKEAKSLIKRYSIRTLPVFLFDKDISAYAAFEEGRDYFIDVQDAYLMHPVYSGVFYFLDRNLEKGKLDVFVDLGSKDSLSLVKAIETYKQEKNLNLYFLSKQEDITINEELMRVLAVKELYPDKLFEYLIGRLENDIRSSYWSDLLQTLNIDADKISDLARSNDAEHLLKKNDILIKELNVGRGGVLLIDNRKIFAISNASGANLKDYLK